MKLAEALVLRADLQKRVAQMRPRLLNNAWMQEGERPAEEPEALLRELKEMEEQLETLVTRINLTNAQPCAGDTTITALLARRDALAGYSEVLNEFLVQASNAPARASRSEIKVLPSVDVQAYRKQADQTARDLRELDMRIQQLNWTTELI